MTETWLPHGPPPSVAVATAAGHAASLKPGCSQPDGPLVEAFHEPSVTTAPSLAITPAGLAVVLVAAIASVLPPARVGTVTVVARFHESVTRREALTFAPLSHTSAVSSPVTTSAAVPAAARSNVRRK
ncbi:hypothetical protein ACIA5D_28420 [Actinoplanes sp. NPDC051513]|uniref:hypothetical protein n=1 Tax=Actinoplanes sp. NPDC051513 TaxID=3363908 RepID=UPI0037A5A2FC